MIRSSLCVALTLLAAAPAAAQPGPLRGFDAYVTRAMAEWKVPGVAVAVIRDTSVVLLKGYGVRTLGRPEPVDPQTMFAIASASKAFTATLVGMMVDDGKMSWDDPATRHLPGFQLFDPYVTREVTMRDLLSHRVGLPRGDLAWYATELPPSRIVELARYLRPASSLRSQFGYQNIMYIAAGEAVARGAGKPWDQVMRDRIFLPLGMTSSHTSTRRFASQPNVASPHEEIEDTVRVIPWRNWDNVAAAGAINSNAADMARWVRFQLDSARVGGKTLLSAGNFTETHTPHTVVRRDAPAREANPYTHFSSYGLGWFLDDYRGRELVHHGGNLDGMTSLVAFLPRERVGVAILTNLDGTGLPMALARRVFDQYLGAPAKDWSADLAAIRAKARQQARDTEKKREAERVPDTRPSLPLAGYAGAYADSLYGEAVVAVDSGRLVLRFGPAFVGPLEHWHFNTFRARWRDPSLGKLFVNFTLGMDGKVAAMSLDGVGEFRRADKADTVPGVRLTAAELARFQGDLRANEAPLTIKVELVGGVLKLTIPGQSPYTLVPETASRFRLIREGVGPGFFLEFESEGGRVRSARLVQPSPRPTFTFRPAP
jgi:CubicO group peptidase (beta-lactamase class C family)